MATGAQTWSTTAASNNSIDTSVNWAEGMAPSAVNNSARAEMASVAMWINDNSGIITTAGSTAAYTITSRQISTAVVDGYTITARMHAANDANATLNVDGVGAKAIHLYAGTALAGGEFLTGSVQRFTYNSGSTSWVLHNYRPSSVSSLLAADGTVGSPSHSFTNDTDCGLYRIGANNIGFTVGGGKVTDWSTGGIVVTGTHTVSGAATLQSSLTVTGAALLSGTGTIAGAATMQSSLTVTGAALFSGAVSMGIASLGSSLTVANNTLLSGTLTVAGAATLQSSLTVTNASLFNGATTFANLATHTSSAVFAAASFSGKVTASSSLEVTNAALLSGVVTVGSSLDVTNGISAASINGAAVAVQSDQETATSIVKAVAPGVQQYHPSAAKFWVNATAQSTAVLASYNVTSITDGVGAITVTIANDFSSVNWVPLALISEGSQVAITAVQGSLAAGSVTIRCLNTGGSPTDPGAWYVAGFGDQ